jgi:hypothetical protein
MIQDEAIKCRYCHSDLTVPPPTRSAQSADSPTVPLTVQPTAQPRQAGSQAVAESAPAGGGSIRYTHSGYRYVLGYGQDFFGLWDRQSPAVPTERFPRTDDGWRLAWTRFASLEPNHVAVPQAEPTAAGPTTAADGPAYNDVMQYTHSGQRYLLGYGRTFFGIWDRQSPAAPTERFTRDDAGWAAAWHRFNQLETHYAEVGVGGSASSGETASPAATVSPDAPGSSGGTVSPEEPPGDGPGSEEPPRDDAS